MTLLRVDDLEVSHGPLQALWGVSLAISAGEKVGLLGANGAGKSTTLGAIVGHYPAQAGRITFDGRDETRSDVNSRLSRGMALVPEGRRLFIFDIFFVFEIKNRTGFAGIGIERQSRKFTG